MTPDCPYTMHGADVPAPGADLHGPDALAELRDKLARARRWAARWKGVARRLKVRMARRAVDFGDVLIMAAEARGDEIREWRRAEGWSNAAWVLRRRADTLQQEVDRLHEQATRLEPWREACRQYGIPEDPEALRAALRHLVSCICVGDCAGRRAP